MFNMFKSGLRIAGNSAQKGTGGNLGAFFGAAAGSYWGPMGASVGMGLGSLIDSDYKEAEEFNREQKIQRALNRQNRPKFNDPRAGRQSALSQFSVSPNQGRQGQASIATNSVGQGPSLLR